MKNSKNTYKKESEKNYNYWESEFDGHGSYMISGEGNEYHFLRSLILAFVKDGDRLLDVGCASGGTYEQLKAEDRKISYKGVDYAQNFTNANKKRHPSIAWETQDARNLDEPDNLFDVVLLYDVLDSLEGWDVAIDEAIRVAKRRVIVLMWMDSNMGDKENYMREKGLRVVSLDIEGDGVHYHKMLVGEK